MIKKYFLFFLFFLPFSTLKAGEFKKTNLIEIPSLTASSEYCENANDYDKCMEFVGKDDSNRRPNKIYLEGQDEDYQIQHEKCLKAADYKGCMTFKNSNANSITNTEEKTYDCSIKWCLPNEIGNYSKDSSGLPLIKGYWFRDNPRSRAAYYISPISKLNVDKQYGRYIHMSHIMRFFENARAGTSGAFIGGNATTNCYGSGSYLTCQSRLPTYIPGIPSKPSGVRQINDDYVFDCDAKIFSIHRNGRIMRSKGSNGKKYKWVDFENADNNLITSRAIQFCNIQKAKINSLKPSGFFKYSDKKIKVKR